MNGSSCCLPLGPPCACQLKRRHCSRGCAPEIKSEAVVVSIAGVIDGHRLCLFEGVTDELLARPSMAKPQVCRATTRGLPGDAQQPARSDWWIRSLPNSNPGRHRQLPLFAVTPHVPSRSLEMPHGFTHSHTSAPQVTSSVKSDGGPMEATGRGCVAACACGTNHSNCRSVGLIYLTPQPSGLWSMAAALAARSSKNKAGLRVAQGASLIPWNQGSQVCTGAERAQPVFRLTPRLGSLPKLGPRLQERSVPCSSFSAHLITASSFSPPCVNLATITVLMAWL